WLVRMWRDLAGVGLWRVGVGGEAAEQALDGGEVDPGLGVLLGVLVVLGEAPAPAMPSDRAFHRPSPRCGCRAPAPTTRRAGRRSGCRRRPIPARAPPRPPSPAAPRPPPRPRG